MKIQLNLFTRKIAASFIAGTAGAVGMLAQIAWLRISVQWFGTSSMTIATVLGTALAGLAIGAWQVRRQSSIQVSNAAASLRLASIFLLLNFLLYGKVLASDEILSWILQHQSLAMWLITLAAMLPVNICLGQVLPLLVADDLGKVRRITPAFAYVWETVGASVGALLAGFYLIQTIGLEWLLLCTSAFALAMSSVDWFRPSDNEEIIRRVSPTSENDKRLSRSLIAAVLLAGVASLGLEIVWQRLLILVVGTDTHSYTIVVVSYLVAISVGAAIAGPLLRRLRISEDKNVAQLWYFRIQLAIVASSILALFVFASSTGGAARQWLAGNPLFGSTSLLSRLTLSSSLLFIPAMLVGASFPVAIQMLRSHDSVDTTNDRTTALVCLLVAAGNVLGVLLAGFILIPWLGLQTTLIALGWLSVVAGFCCLPNANAAKSNALNLSAAGFVVVVGALYLLQLRPLGVGRLPDQYDVRWYREGPANTVTVFSQRDQPERLKMSVDGIVIGESGGGVDEKQQMLAQLPFVLRATRQPDEEADQPTPTSQKRDKVLTIGLGTGILTGQVARQPSVAKVTCVELSPAVIEAANQFEAVNGMLNANPWAEIIQGDGIHFLRTHDQTYDAIISDGKSRPGHAGNVAFFSRDYYELAQRRLTDTGIFVQWFSLQAPLAELQIVLNSFAGVFNEAHMAIGAPDSVYLVGGNHSFRLDSPNLENAVAAVVSDSLQNYSWRTADDFRSMGWLDANQKNGSQSLPHSQSTLINRLSHPVLEQFALDLNSQSIEANKLANLRYFRSLLDDDAIESALPDREQRLAALAIVDSTIAQVAAQSGWLEVDPKYVVQALTGLPKLTKGEILVDQYLENASQSLNRSKTAEAIVSLVTASRLCKLDAERQSLIGRQLLELDKAMLAVDCFSRARKQEPDVAEHHVKFAQCLIRLNKHRAAKSPLERALELTPNNAKAHFALGQVAQASGNRQAAQQHFQRAAELDSNLQPETVNQKRQLDGQLP